MSHPDVGALIEELWRQWRANHAEHCSNVEWPHPEGVECHWPVPAVLVDLTGESWDDS